MGPGLRPGEQLLRLWDETTSMMLQLESGLALRLLDEGGAWPWLMLQVGAEGPELAGHHGLEMHLCPCTASHPGPP